MHAQSKGRELPLTKILDREEFYSERFETEEFFTKNCETGDVILFQDNHFFAKAQRLFTRSNFGTSTPIQTTLAWWWRTPTTDCSSSRLTQEAEWGWHLGEAWFDMAGTALSPSSPFLMQNCLATIEGKSYPLIQRNGLKICDGKPSQKLPYLFREDYSPWVGDSSDR